VKRRGFSLIEALVALMLLTVALIPMAALPAATSRLYMASAAREQAALLAVQKLDELESKDFGSADLGETGSDSFHSDTSNPGYAIRWYVTNITSSSKVVKKQIDMTVTWNNGKSKFEVTRQVSVGAHRTST